MIFNKEIGSWCDTKLVTKLDDIAYQILIDSFYDKEYSKKQGFISQAEVMYEQYMSNTFNKEYNKANIILRKEKLKNINNYEC